MDPATTDTIDRSVGGRAHRHHVVGLAVFTSCGAVALAGTFLPWLHSGSTSRSSYDLLGVIARLGFAPGGIVSLLIRAWPVVPLLLTTAVVLAWWGQVVAALTVSLVGTLYAGGVSIALAVGAADAPIALGVGPWVCSVGSVAFLTSGVAIQWTARRRHR